MLAVLVLLVIIGLGSCSLGLFCKWFKEWLLVFKLSSEFDIFSNLFFFFCFMRFKICLKTQNNFVYKFWITQKQKLKILNWPIQGQIYFWLRFFVLNFKMQRCIFYCFILFGNTVKWTLNSLIDYSSFLFWYVYNFIADISFWHNP